MTRLLRPLCAIAAVAVAAALLAGCGGRSNGRHDKPPSTGSDGSLATPSAAQNQSTGDAHATLTVGGSSYQLDGTCGLRDRELLGMDAYTGEFTDKRSGVEFGFARRYDAPDVNDGPITNMIAVSTPDVRNGILTEPVGNISQAGGKLIAAGIDGEPGVGEIAIEWVCETLT